MHSHRQKLSLNLINNNSSVRFVITYTVQSVTKLNSLKAVKSENVELKKMLKLKINEAFKSNVLLTELKTSAEINKQLSTYSHFNKLLSLIK